MNIFIRQNLLSKSRGLLTDLYRDASMHPCSVIQARSA